MRKANKCLGWILSVMLCLSVAQDARACAFHGYTPDPTLVDLLLATEQVVVARPTALNRYTAVETLLGPPVSDIAIIPTASILRKANRTPSGTVLLARDGAYGPWIEVAVLDDRFRDLVDKVISNQSDWLLGRDSSRVSLFARHLNDPNPDIRRLALQELDRVPYATLKTVRLPKLPTLRQDLETGDPDLMPIRVLLAGLSKDRSFEPVLAAKLDKAIQNNVSYMGAYATARIEAEGKTAVQDIVTRHLGSGALSEPTQEKLLQALALQYKTARRGTRRAISQEVTNLVRTSPDMAPLVTRQFGPQTSLRLLK